MTVKESELPLPKDKGFLLDSPIGLSINRLTP